MSSLISFLTFADLGISNGLLSSIATAKGNNDRGRIKVLVSSAYFALTLIGISVLALFWVIYPHVNWSGLFNVTTDIARAEAGPAAAVFVVCFAMAVPINIVGRVQMGLQKGFMANLWQCGSSLLALVGVLTAIWMQAPLPVLVLAYIGAPLVISALNTLVFYTIIAPDIAPAPALIAKDALRSIMGIGLLFLLLQVVGALTYMSDNIIIAQTMGATAVAQYSVPEKLFALITSIMALALAPLWPAYSEAIAHGDKDWAHRTLRKSLIISGGVAAVCSTVLVLAAPYLIHIWVGGDITPTLFLLLGFGVWKVIESMSMALGMFMNAARFVGFQVAVACLTAICAVPLKIYLIDQYGPAGAVWATSISYTLLVLLPFFILRNRILKHHFK